MNYKYYKYKTKYLELKSTNEHEMLGGSKKSKLNIIILHHPTIFEKPIVPPDLNPIIKKLNKIGKVYNYFFQIFILWK